ncbi:hypothetical protein RO04_07740 [Aggregatibacter actinomycetemcomitans]|uniref:PulJ/GspJ family protein n=1 Tax=Aggregatibacter actinomycetemcomitans TaxID=714 RepID=UPI000519D26F|nr:type II secretion system protein J [Aggregatibacter actinomycetemcomitans]KOE69820.1 hypothetical protein D18P1_0306275 [Aggregatibacter actinomycetemcomitans serotype f str. D18P1]MBN6061854.1 hypothetical protein [Aggregatibacter actinomycetemcomitans]OZV17004.1 hypothetical protein RO04_07740 [Aggregatibacter actinomycetemcomitans]UEL52585.1 type II secretion system protein J [Aggregatibacter actinomycetemcomitans]
MMKNRAFFHVSPYHGQSLVALMISVALSSFLFLVIMQFYSQHQQQNREMLLRLQLQMELQRVIQLMGKDLARSGFRAVNNKLKQNNIALFEQENTPSAVTIAQVNGEKNNSCVLFFYDLDANGCIGGNYKGDACVVNGRNNTREIERELFGYRLHKNMLETRLTYKNAVKQNCSQDECRRYTQQSACHHGGWADLLDEKEYEISQLSFDWLSEQKGIEIRLSGRFKHHKQIEYETSMIVPLLNGAKE